MYFPQLDTLDALTKVLPELSHEATRLRGRKNIELRRHGTADLLLSSYSHQRPHRTVKGAEAFTRDLLTETLGVSPNRQAVATNLKPFFDFAEGKRGYSPRRKRCKAYRPKAHVHAAVRGLVEGNVPLPVRWRTKQGDMLPPGSVPPTNGVPEPLASRIFMPSVIRLTVGKVNRCLGWVAWWIDVLGSEAPLNAEKPDGATLGDARSMLHLTRRWVTSLGGLPNCYAEQSHGRLGPPGFHLIQLPNTLRHLLFEGSDLIDYDLRSAHFSLFISLGKAFGFETTNAEQYITEKDAIHAGWADLTGCRDLGAFKRLTASFLTGGSLAASPFTESGEALGLEAMALLSADAFAQALQREVRLGMQQLFHAELGKDGRDHILTNVLGKELVLEGTHRDFGRACSHILTGYEQWVMREMCAGMSGLVALIYDGMIATEQNTEGLEAHIRETSLRTLGFALDVRIKATEFAQLVPDPGFPRRSPTTANQLQGEDKDF